MRVYVFILISLASVLFAVRASSAVSSTANKDVALKLALNWKAEPQFGGFYEAQRAGIFKRAGFQVEIFQGGAGTPVVQMIANRQMDFGIASADEVIIARSQGADVVALFAVFQTNPQAIMAHAGRGFKVLHDVFLAPGLLAVQKGLPYLKFLEHKFAGEKLQIRARYVPYQGGIANFLADPKFSQQGFINAEPLVAEKNGAKVKSFLIADEGFNPYTTVLITHRETMKQEMEKNERVVTRFVQAVREGWHAYLQRPEETNVMMSGINRAMDLATFNASTAAQRALIEPKSGRAEDLGKMNLQRWETLSHQLKDLNLIKREPKSSEIFLP